MAVTEPDISGRMRSNEEIIGRVDIKSVAAELPTSETRLSIPSLIQGN